MNQWSEGDYWMRFAMRNYGGSFVSSIGEALEHADATNYAKMEAAFPEIFAKYRDMGETLKTKGKAE